MMARLAELYGLAGQTAEGLRVLTDALAAVPVDGERHYEAELYRLRGELLWQSGDRKLEHGGAELHAPEVEANLFQALDIARQQQTKALELRAATSIARLWQAQGRRSDACQLLTEVYGWFTEGFDTLDLQEAQALIAVLA
jgi:predicted ATPase